MGVQLPAGEQPKTYSHCYAGMVKLEQTPVLAWQSSFQYLHLNKNLCQYLEAGDARHPIWLSLSFFLQRQKCGQCFKRHSPQKVKV